MHAARSFRPARSVVALSLGGLAVVVAGVGIDCTSAPGDGGPADPITTTTTTLDVAGYIVGDPQSSADAARASWQAQCDAWVGSVAVASTRVQVVSHDCGMPADHATTGYRFESQATVRLSVRLPMGAMPVRSEVGPLQGAQASSYDAALANWRTACDVERTRLRGLFGANLLAANCGTETPRDAAMTGSRLESSMQVWLVGASGTALDVSGFVSSDPSADISAATAGYRDECFHWVERIVAVAGVDAVTGFDCGTPRDVAMTGYRITASPTAHLSFRLRAGGMPETMQQHIVGPTADSLAGALAGWRQSCRDMIDAARMQYADRLLAASCDEPRDAATTGYRLESNLGLWLGDRAAPPADDAGSAPDGASDDAASPEDASGPPPDDGGGATSSDGGSVVLSAEECQRRCEDQFRACSTGPLSICQTDVCAAPRTEAQMRCAEATACDGFGGPYFACFGL